MFGLSSYVLIGAGIAVVLLVGGFIWYFNWSQSKIGELNENVSALTISVQTNEETITVLTDNFNRFAEEANKLSARINEIRTQTSKLAQLFAQIDLDALAEEDAAALEQKINQETQDILNDLENITAPDTTPFREIRP